MKRYQNKNFIISVEGECEKHYFEHLKELINNNPKRKFNCTFVPSICITTSPLKRIKGVSYIDKKTMMFHIQDIEDANDEIQLKKFNNLLDELSIVNKRATYKLGYTNFCFELWMLLHKREMNIQLANRYQYLKYIKETFNLKINYLDEYKNEKIFKSILKTISLDDVKDAIKRANLIRSKNEMSESISMNQKEIKYKKYTYYRENPDLDIQQVVSIILKECF